MASNSRNIKSEIETAVFWTAWATEIAEHKEN
jgi:hypothetical protein